MSWQFYNPNPESKFVGDCVVRALSFACRQDWNKTYLELSSQGYLLKDMPSSNVVWGIYLKHKGFKRYVIPDKCPDCYTVREFCYDNPKGLFVLATGTHVVSCFDGNYYDSWDSGNEIPIYYFKKEE